MELVSTIAYQYLNIVLINVWWLFIDIVPLAIPIVGIGLVVVLGLKLFKRVANKA